MMRKMATFETCLCDRNFKTCHTPSRCPSPTVLPNTLQHSFQPNLPPIRATPIQDQKTKQAPEVMSVNETIVPTESEKTSSQKYVKKTAVQLTFKCKIEEFEALMNSTEPGEGDLWSEDVTSELAPRAVWKLLVYPNGESEQHKGNISVFLWLTGPMVGGSGISKRPSLNQPDPLQEDNDETLAAAFRIYLVEESDDNRSKGKHSTSNFGREACYNRGGRLSHDQVKKALHEDGSLLVAADVEFFLPDECDAKAIDESTLQGYEGREQWANKFSKLYGDQAFSDCSIEIGGVSIPALKGILAANSPVFEAMFTNPASEESKSNVIKITDSQRPEPMRALVRYCYQGYLDDAAKDGDCAVEIFKLADKYCIDDLKAQMEEHFIRKRLSVGNVINMAVLADAHFAPKLKKTCIELIASKWDTVSASAEWKKLGDEMPELAAELAETAIAEE